MNRLLAFFEIQTEPRFKFLQRRLHVEERDGQLKSDQICVFCDQIWLYFCLIWSLYLTFKKFLDFRLLVFFGLFILRHGQDGVFELAVSLPNQSALRYVEAHRGESLKPYIVNFKQEFT